MSEVLTGKGPQPPSVYWIRRGLVALVAVVLVGLLVWAFMPKNQGTAVPEPADTPTPAESLSPAPSTSPSASSTSPSPSPSPSAAGPQACEPIGVQLAVKGFRSVKSGKQQTFSVTAENNTAMPCVMEINQNTFVLKVASGSDLVFSTAHCKEWLPSVKKQTLKAGAAVEFKVNWKTFRSAPECRALKMLLGAGTYVATAAYKESSTARMAFVLTKA